VTSGCIGTGEFAHEWAHLLREEVALAGPFAFVFDTDPPEYVGNLLRTLGVEILVERGAELRVVSL
jgi:hypothetical protein